MKVQAAVFDTPDAARPYATSRPLRVEEFDLEAPGPTEILLRIDAAGLCHSDLSVVDGNRRRPLPMVLGHEASGIVTETGADVHDLSVGDRVVATFLPLCGTCEVCLSGDGRLPCPVGSAANGAGTLIGGGRRLSRGGAPVNHHLGVSGFASHAVLDRRSVVRVGHDVPADIAAVLGCAVLTGGGAVLNAGTPRAGQTVAVVGLGGVGMAALLVAASIEGVHVVGIDANPAKLELAIDLGAHGAMSPAEARDGGLAADVVVECAGVVPAFEAAVALTAPGGKMVTVGLPAPTALAKVSPLELVSGAKQIIGSYLGSAVPARDIPFYEKLWRDGRLPLEKLITSHVALADVNEALDALAEGEAVRQIIDVGGSA